MIRALAFLFSAFAIAGCAVPPPTIDMAAETRSGLRVTDVEIAYAPDRKVFWADAEHAFAKKNGCKLDSEDCDFWRLVETEEAHDYMLERIQDEMLPTISASLESAWDGNRPVKARILVRRLVLASVAQRAVIGGRHSLVADFEIVDPRTNEVLARMADLGVAVGRDGLRMNLGAANAAITLISIGSSEMFRRGPIARLSDEWAEAAVAWMNADSTN